MPVTSTTGVRAEFDLALRAWERAQVIHEGPPKGASEAWSALESIGERPGDFHDLLVASLSHPSQVVVGYCLIALDRMRSVALKSLPTELLARRDKITILMGSFSRSMDIGGLARQLTKKWSGHVA
jgi:hypothetical protein